MLVAMQHISQILILIGTNGYYYDEETGYYYLNSRYYSPEWQRFLNADSIITGSLLGTNMYSYCGNNPVNYYDPDGCIPIVAQLVDYGSQAVSLDWGAVWTNIWYGIPVAWNQLTTALTSYNSQPMTKSQPTTSTKDNFSYMAGGTATPPPPNNNNNNKGYNSFSQVKKAVGSPGAGNQWHHIVEQSQIRKSGFDVQLIQNPKNLLSVSKGVHQQISGYYSSVQDFSNGMRVRDWLAGQSYQAQYNFGIGIIQMFGGGK